MFLNNKYTLNLIFLIALTFSCNNVNKPNQPVQNAPNIKVKKDTITFPYKHSNTNLNKDTSIIVAYAAIGCTCAQWALKLPLNIDYDMYNREHIYLEPANTIIINADSLWDGEHLFQLSLKGRFYKEKGYPENYNPAKGAGEPARVFKYNQLTILKR